MSDPAVVIAAHALTYSPPDYSIQRGRQVKFQLASRLRSLPELGRHQVVASQLASNGMDGNPIYKSDYIGRTVAVRHGNALIAGPLVSVIDSVNARYLILGIGDFVTVPVTYMQRVTVAPEGGRMSITVKPADEEES